jgi:hypothetical protein
MKALYYLSDRKQLWLSKLSPLRGVVLVLSGVAVRKLGAPRS